MYRFLRFFIPLILFVWSCKGDKTKLSLLSNQIDGGLNECISIKPKKQYYLSINEETFDYEVKVEIQKTGDCSTEALENQQLHLDLLDENGSPVTNFGKFKGPTYTFNNEYKELLNGHKESMMATFTYNGLGFTDIVEGIQALQKREDIKQNKKEILKRLRAALKSSGAKSFRVTSF